MNYQAYAAELGFPDAQYLASSQEELLPIGAEHRSVTILGQGTFGEVHKALHIRTAKAVAIKILNGRGRDEMKEVNIMSKLNHESIIKYERAFALPSGKICIVMELAVNDLETHLKARQNSKGKAHLSLECFQSINRQALSGLDYLHRQGVTHRDLKTTNILVTKWDTKTDTPTIKLADFGLAGIGSKHTTFCGTKGYVAPEVIQAHQSTETLKKQKDKGMETNSQNQLLVYTHAVDIWTLGKIFQELLQYVPSVRRGRRAPVIKEPALRLIRLMMQDNPGTRPTAAECLKHPWVAIVDSSDNVQA
ncbi:kinase-like domain-containing protein, partial [Xylogone sp. PMI_703]